MEGELPIDTPGQEMVMGPRAVLRLEGEVAPLRMKGLMKHPPDRLFLPQIFPLGLLGRHGTVFQGAFMLLDLVFMLPRINSKGVREGNLDFQLNHQPITVVPLYPRLCRLSFQLPAINHSSEIPNGECFPVYSTLRSVMWP